MREGVKERVRETERSLAGWAGDTRVSPRVGEGEEENTVPGRQGQRPEYQEEGSGGRRLSGWRGVGAFSVQGTRVLKHPRLCLSRRTPSRSHGLLAGQGEGNGDAGNAMTQ